LDRRRFLKYAGTSVALVGASAGALWYESLSRPATTLTQTLTSASSTRTSLTSSSNPVAEYAKEQGLNPEIIPEIQSLGEDGIDQKDTTIVDYLVDIQHFDFSSHQKKYPNPDGERLGMQQKLVKTVLADESISDTEYSALTFLHEHPTPMQPKLAKYNLDEAALVLVARGASENADPELVCELSRLPDIKDNEEKYIEFFDNMIKLSGTERNKQELASMLSEGLQYGRRYCTPLQCLYWLWLDGKEIEGYLRPYSTARVVNEAWHGTSTSGNYKSNKWTDFEEVTDRLCSGYLSSKFAHENFTYKPDPLHTKETSLGIFILKHGRCLGFALFDFVCLEKNGFSPRIYYLEYANEEFGHYVDTYFENGRSYLCSNGARRGYTDLKNAFAQIADEQQRTLVDWTDVTDYLGQERHTAL
jgi:hypothetical protein